MDFDGFSGHGGFSRNGEGPANSADIRADVCAALGQIASAKDEAALAALGAIASEKSKNKTLKTAANDAIRKIKERK